MCRFLIMTAISVLSGMGVGGGGLLILYLLACGENQLVAQAQNLLFYLICATVSLLCKLREEPLPKFVIPLCLAGAIGAIPGCLLAQVLPLLWLRRIFGGMLTAGGLLVLFGKKLLPDLPEP